MGVLVVFGYGPGISHATAERFAREGHPLALVGRNADRLAEGLSRLKADGLRATAYQSDASDPTMIRQTIEHIRNDHGTVSTILWTAFRSGGVTNVLEVRPERAERAFDVGVTGLLTAVQESLDDLKASPDAAILVANGAVGEPSTEADRFAKILNIDGVGLENAAKSKLVGILAERLREFDIYVGEITIAGSVTGTATEVANAIDPSTIADLFWSMSRSRDLTRVRMT